MSEDPTTCPVCDGPMRDWHAEPTAADVLAAAKTIFTATDYNALVDAVRAASEPV